MSRIDDEVRRGDIGGRTAQIVDTGQVECHVYPVAPLSDDQVRIKTVRSGISPGTEMTFIGPKPSNPYLTKTWNEDLRLFEAGPPTITYPITFGYRAAGEVIESRFAGVGVGARVYGNWRHTEFLLMPGAQAGAQMLPDDLSWDDGIDVGQMGPICVNAVAFGEAEHRAAPVVVFGAGPIGLLTAQVAKADGAKTVYVVDRLASRLAIAESLGLEPVESDQATDVAATLKRRHGAEGIPVAFECTGSTSALNEAIRLVRRRGLVVAVGFYQGDAVGLRLGDEFHHNGIRLVCGQIGNIHPSHDWASLRLRAIELCRTGQVRFGELPRMTLPIEDVRQGLDALKRPQEILQVVLAYE